MRQIPGGIMTERYVDRLRREHRARMRRLWPSKRIIPIICHDPKEPEAIPVRHRPIVAVIGRPRKVKTASRLPTVLCTLEGILDTVCARHNLARSTVSSKKPGSNKPRVVAARMEYCYLAARDTERSVREIGARIDRHRATVIYAVAGYCEEHGLPLPRPGKWDAYRKRKERYRAMRDVSRSVGYPTSEQSAASQPDQCPESGSAFPDAVSDSRQSPLAATLS